MKNKKFKFEKIAEPILDKLFLRVEFAGGDADTEHPEEYDLKISFSEYEDYIDKIQKEINLYKRLGRILDINCTDYCENYDDVEEKFGYDLATEYDDVPNDPQSDYQNKCYIQNITLIGYDENGTKHRAFV